MSFALTNDLDHILAHTRPLWEDLRGQRLFLTGGTGFFGRWLLESFACANRELGLGAEVVVLSRNPERFRTKARDLCATAAIHFHQGDIRDFSFPNGEFPFIIHGATDIASPLGQREPLQQFDTIVEGTRRTLDFAIQAHCRAFLLISSGAVYGIQPPALTHMPESYLGGPNTLEPVSTYAEGKRTAELLCALYHQRRPNLEPKIARCFAFVGPYLPLDAHFAIGNFMRDALAGSPIRVNGDGTPYRSYLYAADLAIWLWTILFRASACRPYNVGSEDARTIADMARVVATAAGDCPVEIARRAGGQQTASRFVPQTDRARTELHLEAWTHLETAVARTLAAYRANNAAPPAATKNNRDH